MCAPFTRASTLFLSQKLTKPNLTVMEIKNFPDKNGGVRLLGVHVDIYIHFLLHWLTANFPKRFDGWFYQIRIISDCNEVLTWSEGRGHYTIFIRYLYFKINTQKSAFYLIVLQF